MTSIAIIGSGFAARGIASAFCARGDQVRVLVAPDASPAVTDWLARRGARVESGVFFRDDEAIDRAVDGATQVVHAGCVPPPLIAGRWTRAEYDRIHVAGTEAILSSCRRKGVKRVMMVSGQSVTLDTTPRTHTDETRPAPGDALDDYSETLALAEDLVLGALQMETLALRPGWLWGPGDTEWLPAMLRASRAGGIPLVGGGRTLVPTTHVAHLADAALLASDAEFLTAAAYYVTDDERVTWRGFATRLFATLGLRARFNNLPWTLARGLAWLRHAMHREGAIGHAEVYTLGQPTFFNLKKIRAELGYAPRAPIGTLMMAMARWAEAIGGAAGLEDTERALSVSGDAYTAVEPAEGKSPNEPSKE